MGRLVAQGDEDGGADGAARHAPPAAPARHVRRPSGRGDPACREPPKKCSCGVVVLVVVFVLVFVFVCHCVSSVVGPLGGPRFVFHCVTLMIYQNIP